MSTTARSRVALALYGGVVAVLILAPFDFSLPHGLTTAVEESLRSDTYALLEIVKSSAHAALFLPLAALLARAFGLPATGLLGIRAILGVAVLAASTELAQLTVSRGAGLTDALMDVAGYVVGALALRLHDAWAPMRTAIGRLTRPSVLVALLLSYALVLLVILLPLDALPFAPAGLSGIDPGFPLLIGNERTRTRSWAGEIERLEIRSHAPATAEPQTRADGAPALDGVVADYDFRAPYVVLDAGGEVREVRSVRGPVLEARRPGVRAVAGGGIDLRRGALLQSSGDSWARSLEEIRRRGELTILARIRPSTIFQGGPARIVSSSWDRRSRNFTLSQEGDGLELRVRTPLTGPNGDQPALFVRGCLAPGLPADIVARYSRGVLRLAVNGSERGSLRVSLLGALTFHVFHSALTRRLALGLAYAFWVVGLVPLWILAGKLGVPAPRCAVLAGLGSAAMALLVWLISTLA